MANPSPLMPLHEQADAQLMSFGEGVAIVAMHEAVETEYGRLRNRAALMDCPHHALIELTGNDRLDFLHRLLTNDCKGLTPGTLNRQFLLTAKGRIIADMLVIECGDKTLLDTDIHSAPALLDELNKLLFSEDVRITNVTDQFHRLSLHGPKAAELLATSLDSHQHAELTLAGVTMRAIRHDQCGALGIHLWMKAADAPAVWKQLTPTDEEGRDIIAKPLGWLAFNMARIEAGSPLFHVDFGPDSLPGETGIVDQACSPTKGCYRGQEIVARMRDLGHPGKILTGFIGDSDALPIAGISVFVENRPDADVIGAITSSTPSPLRGGSAIGFALLKWGHHEPGTTLYCPADGATRPITVHSLKFV